MKRLINWIFPDITIGSKYDFNIYLDYVANRRVKWFGTNKVKLPTIAFRVEDYYKEAQAVLDNVTEQIGIVRGTFKLDGKTGIR